MNKIFTSFLLAFLVASPAFVLAQETEIPDVEAVSEEVSVEDSLDTRIVGGDFVGDYALQPAKVEVFLKPGEERTEVFTFTNRTENTRDFVINLEDFTSGEGEDAIRLLGEEEGPFSLKKFLFPEVTSFTLKPNEQIKLPVVIRVPFDAEPGGRFGSVIFKLDSSSDLPGVTTVSRVGALILAQIEGDIVEDSTLLDYKVNDRKGGVFLKGPFQFKIDVENNGNVHTVPWAMINISNMTGKLVESVPISAYFILPGSKRLKSLVWDADFAFGRYSAELEFNHGYDDKQDIETINFWVIPLKVIIIAIAIFLLFVIIGMALGRRR